MAALILAVAMTACATEPTSQAPSATPASPPAAKPQRLDDTALATVQDAFVACARREQTLGIVVTYRDGLAVSEDADAEGRRYDRELSAPNEVARLVDGGQARYVGLRADQDEDAPTPRVDVLIFPSEVEAAVEAVRLGEEAGIPAEPDGAFVTIGEPSMPAAAEEALAACREQVRPGT